MKVNLDIGTFLTQNPVIAILRDLKVLLVTMEVENVLAKPTFWEINVLNVQPNIMDFQLAKIVCAMPRDQWTILVTKMENVRVTITLPAKNVISALKDL